MNYYGIVGSMGRMGAAGDNAAMESFSALLQVNVLDLCIWATCEEPRIPIVTWINAPTTDTQGKVPSDN